MTIWLYYNHTALICSLVTVYILLLSAVLTGTPGVLYGPTPACVLAATVTEYSVYLPRPTYTGEDLINHNFSGYQTDKI